MKNFKFINQSLWAGSSPNQTGETLTRQNRIGGNSWLNRSLMLLITILTIGVGQMWAWWDMALIGDFTTNGWTASSDYKIEYALGGGGDGKAHRFLPFYTSSGDKYWRLWGDNRYNVAPLTNNYVISYGSKYQVKGTNPSYAFKTTVAAGVISIHSHQSMTEDKDVGDVNGSNDEPAVWLERPTIYIWHNWSGNTSNWGANGGSGQKAMTDKEDGTYTYDGVYSASGTNVGIEGSTDIKKYFADGNTTKLGSPSSGNKCRFTWNSNGYLGKNGETSNRGTLTITKILTITYNKNGAGSGSAPDAQEVLYNTATATYTNTGSMTKTNMAFIGWNTQADGKGTHYDAGANITLTSNQTLYAEWVPCWVLRGGDTNGTSNATQDAMGNWGVPIEFEIIGTNAFMLELNLAASTTYYFKICDRHNGKKADYSTYLHYGNNGEITNTITDWLFETDKGNCRLTTGSNGGTWRFAWNANSKRLCVYKPADAPKSSFVSGKYLYLDARSNSNWKADNTKAKFWFKNLATGEDDGNVVCNYANRLEGGVYYAVVPADKTLGAVQMNKRNQSTDAIIYTANKAYARERSNANQNSMVTPSSGGDNIDLSWGTYCPPMTVSSVSDNGTTTYGGNGGSSTPYLIAAGSQIKLTATSTSAVPGDDNMTAYYQYKNNGSEIRAGSSTATYNHTSSETNNTNYTITVDAYNYYNSTSGTHLTSSVVYYQTRTPYTISYAKGSPAASISGSRDSEIKVYGVDFTLPSSAVFTREHYTQTGWTTSDGGTQTHELGGSYTTNSAQPFYPVWTDNKHSVTVAAGANGSVSTSSVSNVGIETKSAEISATPNTGYHFTGWTLPSGVTAAAGYTSASNPIKINATADSRTITANFEANSYTVVFNANYPSGKRFDNGGSMSNQGFTYDVTQNLTSNAFGCEGYTFAGWATTAERANAGTVDHTNGKSVSNLTSENGGTFNLYAVWTDNNTYVFDGGTEHNGTDWNADANWTKGKKPSDLDNHDVYIIKPAAINAGNAFKAKSVRIVNAGSYTPMSSDAISASGRLDIWYTGSLIVKTDILNYDLSKSATSPTTWRTLNIWSDYRGTGALIAGAKIDHDTASVSFYTKARSTGAKGGYVNQFFGIPFTSCSPLNYYGVYLYKYQASDNSFQPAASATMNSFDAYLMLRTETTTGSIYMDGELCLPGTSDASAYRIEKNLVSDATSTKSNMFANSWMGPIDIRAMETAGDGNDFVGVEPTFYLFNAGSSEDAKKGGAGNDPGQWTVLPVEAIKTDWNADDDLDLYAQYVIPSQQAFLVVATSDATDASHTLKLDYKKHVYDPAVAEGVTVEPTRAPQRETDYLDRPERIRLNVTGESGNGDKVIIYAREDFSTGFDNGWEGYKINGSNFAPQMYTLGDNGKMAINAIPDVEGSVIGFKPGTEDVQYTFTFKYRGENTWYLNDLKEQTSTLIDELDSYTFTSAEGDMEARFIISRTPIAYMPTGIDNGGGAVEGVSARKLMIDGTLYIIRNGQMFTAEGQMVK